MIDDVCISIAVASHHVAHRRAVRTDEAQDAYCRPMATAGRTAMHARPSACIGCEGLNFSQSNQHHHDALHKVYVTLNRLPSCLQSWHARQLRAYFIWLRRDSRPCADLAREGSPLRRTKCVQLAHLHFTRYQRAVARCTAGASHHSLAVRSEHVGCAG